MEEIIDGIEDENCDVVVDGWMRVLSQKKKIWFEKLYNEDIEGRNMVSEDVAATGKRKGKGKEKENESGDGGFESLKVLMEVGLKDLGEKMSEMETKVFDKLAVMEKKVKYVMNYVLEMDEATGKEKVVSIGGEPSTGKEKGKEVATALEKENEVVEILEKENEVEKKKRKLSYSKLVTGPFKPPNTRSRMNTSS